MSPKVSVVLCGYNQGEFLREAVDSVLGQTFTDLELIAVDNGSNDDSAAILRTYEKDPRVRLMLYPKNESVNRRWNQAVAEARGEFVSFLLADDFYLPDKLRRHLDCFQTLPSDFAVVYCPSYRLNVQTNERWVSESLKESGNVLEKMLLDYFRQGPISFIAPLIKRDILARIPFYEDVFSEGEAYFFRLAMNCKFHYLDEPLVVMRDHPKNMGKAIKLNSAILQDVLHRLERDPAFPRELTHALNVFWGRHLLNCAWQGVRVAEDGDWAIACVRTAISRRPGYIMHPKVQSALLLAMLPKALLHAINAVADRLLAYKGVRGFKTDYS